eukprot:gene14800-20855_t
MPDEQEDFYDSVDWDEIEFGAHGRPEKAVVERKKGTTPVAARLQPKSAISQLASICSPPIPPAQAQGAFASSHAEWPAARQLTPTAGPAWSCLPSLQLSAPHVPDPPSSAACQHPSEEEECAANRGSLFQQFSFNSPRKLPGSSWQAPTHQNTSSFWLGRASHSAMPAQPSSGESDLCGRNSSGPEKQLGQDPEPQSCKWPIPGRAGDAVKIKKPRCPFSSCPGVYSPCLGALKWVQSRYADSQGFWGCDLFPSCNFRYFPPTPVDHPQLSLEICADNLFKVVAAPGSEDAVEEAGGVNVVLQGVGVDTRRSVTLRAAARQGDTASLDKQGETSSLDDGKKSASLDKRGELASLDIGGKSASLDRQGETASLDSIISFSGKEMKSGKEGPGGLPQSLGRPDSLSLACTDRIPCDDSQGLRFSLSDVEYVEGKLRHYKRNILPAAGGDIPTYTLRSYRGQLLKYESEEYIQRRLSYMPAPLADALMDFQRTGVRFGLEHSGRCLIGDEDEWPLLVVCPASLRLMWAEEFEKWMPHQRPSQIHVIEGKDGRLSLNSSTSLPLITITSYEMLRRLTCEVCGRVTQTWAGQAPPGQARGPPFGQRPPPYGQAPPNSTANSGGFLSSSALQGGPEAGPGPVTLGPQSGQRPPPGTYGSACAAERGPCVRPTTCLASLGWKVIIVDESHNLKTTNARHQDSPQTEACVTALKKSKRVILLTGTPSLSRPFDLFRQVDAIRPGILGPSKDHFAQRYCDRRLVPTVLGGGFGVRKRFDNSVNGRYSADPSRMSDAFKTAIAKLPDVIEWLTDALGSGGLGGEGQNEGSQSVDSGPKFIVFAHHIEVMDRLAAALGGFETAQGGDPSGAVSVESDSLDEISNMDDLVRRNNNSKSGSFPGARRMAVNKFRDDPSIRVALLSITAAAVGLDFSRASVVVFVELPNELFSAKVNTMFTSGQTKWQKLNNSLINLNQLHDGTTGEEPAATNSAPNAHGQASLPADSHQAVSTGGAAGGTAGGAAGQRNGPARGAHHRGLVLDSVIDMKAVDQSPPASKTSAVVDDVDAVTGRQQQQQEEEKQKQGKEQLLELEQDKEGMAVRADAAADEDEDEDADFKAVACGPSPVCIDLVSDASQPTSDVAWSPAAWKLTSPPPGTRSQPGNTSVPVGAKPPVKDCVDPTQSPDSPPRQAIVLSPLEASSIVAVKKKSMTHQCDSGSVTLTLGGGHAQALDPRGLDLDDLAVAGIDDADGHATLRSPKPPALAPTHSPLHPTPPPQATPMTGPGNRNPISPSKSQSPRLATQAGLLPPTPVSKGTRDVSKAKALDTYADCTPRLGTQAEPPPPAPDSKGKRDVTNARASHGHVHGTPRLGSHAELPPPTPDSRGAGGAVKARSHQNRVHFTPRLGTQAERPLPTPASKGAGGAVKARTLHSHAHCTPMALMLLQSSQQVGTGATPGAVALSQHKGGPDKHDKHEKQRDHDECEQYDPLGTGRVHLHLAPDGSVPLGLSIPLELLVAHQGSAVDQIVKGHAGELARWEAEQEAERGRSGGCGEEGRVKELEAAGEEERVRGLQVSVEERITVQQANLEEERVRGQQATVEERMAGQGGSVEEERVRGQEASEEGGGRRVALEEGRVAERDATPEEERMRAQEAIGEEERNGECEVHGEGWRFPPSLRGTAGRSLTGLDLGQADMGVSLVNDTEQHLHKQQQHQGQAEEATVVCAVAPPKERRPGVSFVGPCGLVAVGPQLDAAQLLEVLHEAQLFARDWNELRSVTKSRLFGRVINANLQDAVELVTAEAAAVLAAGPAYSSSDAVELVTAEAAAAGAFGSSTTRYIQDAPKQALPEGAEWRVVRMKARNMHGNLMRVRVPDGEGGLPGQDTFVLREYQQAFKVDGSARLCIHCVKEVADCKLAADVVLDSTMHLFCGPACEHRYYLKASSGAIRRALSKLERGVCVTCQLDCRALVAQLQCIRYGSKDWSAKRMSVIRKMYPRLAEKQYKSYCERLLQTPTEGMAWNADHIIPVYKGGGLCELDNLRTLCVACHADVTKEQMKERTAERRQKALKTADIRTFFSPSSLAKTDASSKQGEKGNKRKRASKTAFVDEDDVDIVDPEGGKGGGGAKPKAKKPRGKADKPPAKSFGISAASRQPSGGGSVVTINSEDTSLSKAQRLKSLLPKRRPPGSKTRPQGSTLSAGGCAQVDLLGPSTSGITVEACARKPPQPAKAQVDLLGQARSQGTTLSGGGCAQVDLLGPTTSGLAVEAGALAPPELAKLVEGDGETHDVSALREEGIMLTVECNASQASVAAVQQPRVPSLNPETANARLDWHAPTEAANARLEGLAPGAKSRQPPGHIAGTVTTSGRPPLRPARSEASLRSLPNLDAFRFTGGGSVGSVLANPKLSSATATSAASAPTSAPLRSRGSSRAAAHADTNTIGGRVNSEISNQADGCGGAGGSGGGGESGDECKTGNPTRGRSTIEAGSREKHAKCMTSGGLHQADSKAGVRSGAAATRTTKRVTSAVKTPASATAAATTVVETPTQGGSKPAAPAAAAAGQASAKGTRSRLPGGGKGGKGGQGPPKRVRRGAAAVIDELLSPVPSSMLGQGRAPPPLGTAPDLKDGVQQEGRAGAAEEVEVVELVEDCSQPSLP